MRVLEVPAFTFPFSSQADSKVLTEVVLALEAVVVVLVEVEHLENSKRW